ncbi:hypothetical protein JW964_15215 [candidate division KSB1 bacterium]|nr:hypothetical protein [candidate division KSB1 bacterium]
METMTTHLEELFESAGDRFDDNLIEAIIQNYSGPQKEVKDTGANKGEEKKKEGKKKESDSGLKKDQFKPFIEAIEKENYPAATIELLELGAKLTNLNTNTNYHALVSICFVALKKYNLAEMADKAARQLDLEWGDIFDELADEVYDSGLFFTAESLGKDVRDLELEAKMEDLEWEKDDIQFLIDDIKVIFNLENEKLAKTLADEKLTAPIGASSTLDDVIIAICDEFILPFYARLELQKLVSKYKDDDSGKSSKSKNESRK